MHFSNQQKVALLLRTWPLFDKSEKKQGRFTPGTNIPIKSPKDIQKSKTEYLLLLSWNIKEEIMKQEKNFLKNGGKFIVPFPSPRIISK